MTIEFYNTTDPTNKLVKTLKDKRSLPNVKLKNETDFKNPMLILKKDNAINRNYAYIPDFKRYYFVETDVTDNDSIIRIRLTVDVLMTYASQIKGLGAIVERQQNNYNLYLEDAEVPNYAYRRVQTKIFPLSPITTNQQYVLITNGR